MAGKREEQLKEITERLEQGVEDLFTSEKYKDYLKTMSQFHNYSFNNTLLIAMQKPDATLVAGYQAWQKKFNRHVKKGEKGIQIISPAPIRQKEEVEKLDPDTREPVLEDNGQPETEEVEYVIPRFKVATVFDYAQTEGEPLPLLGAEELTASVENYEIFMQAITAVSPVPIRFDEVEGESHGYYHNVDKEIVIKQGMSESQTIKTAIHEVVHATIHDRELMESLGMEKDQMTKEVEAESISYTVLQYFGGVDSSEYSFPYIAGWSSNKDMKELRASMDMIRHTAGELIESLTEKLQELQRNEPEKNHLQDSDLMLKIAGSREREYSFAVVRGMDKEQLLEAVKDFQRVAENEELLEEPDLETYLSERGAEVIPWYASDGHTSNFFVDFYDLEYDYDIGITDAAALSSMKQAEMLINRAEYEETIFNNDEKNLIVNYAYQFDNMADTRALINEWKEALQAPDVRIPYEIIQQAQAEIDALPDPMIGMTRMHEYGYKNSGMLPLTKERALELYHQNLEIFCLYEDGTEATYDNEAALHTHDGIYGIEKESWEKYQSQMKEEKKIMAGQEDKFQIYQIRSDGGGREYQFMGTSFLESQGLQARGEDYDLMYTDVLTEKDTLDSIFQRFNLDRPDDFYGHSLSVSDVIVVSRNGESKNYYVDSFGFTELPDFFLQRENEITAPAPQLSIAERIQNYDLIKDSIYMQLIPQEGNADLLEMVPHRLFYDMAVIYKIPLAERPGGTITSTLKNGAMEMYGITEEHLFQDALESTQRNYPVKITQIGQMIREMAPSLEPDLENGSFGMYIVSNEQLEHGAAAFLYPDFLEQAKEIVGGNFYILPSSQHELMLMEETDNTIPQELVDMVREMNETEMVGENKLSDSVFHYDAETKQLEMVGDISTIEPEQKRTEYLPVFRGTLAEATEHGMADAYLDSRKLNMDCKYAIEDAIRDNFNDYHLSHEVVTPVLEEYGAERMAFVLAETLQKLSYDGRFSRENKAWADRIVIPENRRDEMDLNADYVVTSHPAVLDGFVGMFREEAREQLQKLDAVLTAVPKLEPTELAFAVGENYLLMHETDEGYDYTFYGKDYLEIDGGVYDNPKVSIYEALQAVLQEEGYSMEDCTPMDYEELDEAVGVQEEARFKRLQMEMNEKNSKSRSLGENALTSENTQKDTALNGMSRAEIEELVLDYAQSELDAMGLVTDVKLLGARVYGSRTREGLFTEGSDIDVVLSYEGDIAEDTLFNALHEHGMKVAGIPLDVNPISVEKTGTLEEYLAEAEKYPDEKEAQRESQTIKEPVGRVTFVDGEVFVYTEPEEYLKTIEEEIEYSQTSGFQYTTLSDDPALRKAVDDRVYNLIGEENPHDLSYYQETQSEIAEDREALRLAVVLDELSEEIDPYGYRDTVEDRERHLLEMRDDLLAGGEKVETMKAWFAGLEDLPEDQEKRVQNILRAMDSFTNRESVEQTVPEKEAAITFYVAECMEFPVLGQYEENLTMEEALKIYEEIPAQRMNGIKGVGFRLEDGSMYDGEYELMSADRVDAEMINCIEHYKQSPLVQDAIQKMQAYLETKGKEKAPVVTEQIEENSLQEYDAPEKKEQPKLEQYEEPAGKTVESASKPEPVQTQIKQPEQAQAEGKGKKGKKESVLKALRDRQTKIKAQEQNQPAKDKSQQNKKGDMDL